MLELKLMFLCLVKFVSKMLTYLTMLIIRIVFGKEKMIIIAKKLMKKLSTWLNHKKILTNELKEKFIKIEQR